VLRRWMMWCSYIDMEFCWVCVTSWGEIWMRYGSKEKQFEGSRLIVYNESVVCIGAFPQIPLLLNLIYSKPSYDCATVLTFVLF